MMLSAAFRRYARSISLPAHHLRSHHFSTTCTVNARGGHLSFITNATSSQWIRRSIFVAVAGSAATAWYYRPVADSDPRGGDGNGPDRGKEVFCSSAVAPPWCRDSVPFLLSCARGLSIGITTLAIRLFMNTYGSYEIFDDEHYGSFVETVLGGNGRTPDQGLITVSNHRSLFDDPGMVSCLLPLWIAIRPKYNRWGICSQEYCFNDVLPGIAKGFIGAGQVLPICRGAGINQKLLLDFARHLSSGEWLQIFPEGGVWQWDELGGRRVGEAKPASDAQRRLPVPKLGKLKWGVGKLIAHAPVRPKVIPFAHAGTENLFPQDEITGVTQSIFGGELRVRIRFGGELQFDDLIDDHEEKHGKLWKYDAAVGKYELSEKGRSSGDFHRLWDSSKEEMELYTKIAKRIEIHLEQLTKKVVTNSAF